MKDTFGMDDKLIPIYFPSSVVRWLETEGYAREDLIKGTGLKAAEIDEPEVLISFRGHRRIIENALELTNNPHLGLAFGLQLQITSMGIVGYAAMSAQNIGESLKILVKFIKLRALLIYMELEHDGDKVILHVNESLDLGPARRFIYEALISSTGNMLGFHGLDVLPGMIYKLKMDQPEDWDDYKHQVPVPVLYNQPINCLELPAALMNTPLKMADPVAASSAAKLCEEQLQQIEKREGLINRLHALIENTLSNPPTLTQAADHFCVSPRTLRRELEKLDTTYQKQLDHFRQDAAINYLKSSNLTVQEISDKLGYNDSSNFARAFRKWTGKSPGDFRK